MRSGCPGPDGTVRALTGGAGDGDHGWMAGRLVVERVAAVWRRPWVMVTGRLEGGPLAVGDPISIAHSDNPAVTAVIRSIEAHGPGGQTTIAIDSELAGSIGPGAVISGPG